MRRFTIQSNRSTSTATLAMIAGAVVLVAASGRTTEAQSPSLVRLTTFGSNGWLAPGSTSYLGTGNNERGLAYNPVTKNLVLVSRATVLGSSTNVVILNGTTGAQVKLMNTTGVSAGTFVVNMAGVGADGAIYVSNLTTSATVPFKVYKWASEASTVQPTVAYSANPTGGVTRIGDSFDVFGSDASAKFAAAGTMGTGTFNSNFLVGSLDQTNTGTAYLGVPSTTTTSNDYRLSLAFVDTDTLIGSQGGTPRFTDFGASATATAMQVLTGTGLANFGAAQRALDYAVVGGKSVMAILDSNSSLIQVYDVTNPAQSVLLVSGSTVVTPLSGNAGGTGQLAWGAVNGDVATLYAMNTNQGIQAMIFTVPEPSTTAMLAMGGVGAAAYGWRNRRKARRQVAG
jgi:hypothetical protein